MLRATYDWLLTGCRRYLSLSGASRRWQSMSMRTSCLSMRMERPVPRLHPPHPAPFLTTSPYPSPLYPFPSYQTPPHPAPFLAIPSYPSPDPSLVSHTTPHHATPYHTSPYHTTPRHTPHHTTPHHTTPHKATAQHTPPPHPTPHHTDRKSDE